MQSPTHLRHITQVHFEMRCSQARFTYERKSILQGKKTEVTQLHD